MELPCLKKGNSMKIGVFGGTFDPIHNGHINIIKKCLEKLNLDKILVIPNNKSPHKDSAVANTYQRYKMIELALGDMGRAEICDMEINSNNISYTVDTIKRLYNKNDELFFIIGSDTLEIFHTFKDCMDIYEMVKLAVYPRSDDFKTNFDIIKIDAGINDISSTDIRENINKNMLPIKVYEYIIYNGIYGDKN